MVRDSDWQTVEESWAKQKSGDYLTDDRGLPESPKELAHHTRCRDDHHKVDG